MKNRVFSILSILGLLLAPGRALAQTGNTATGTNALENNTGSDNTADGIAALEYNDTAWFNTGVGYEALVFPFGCYGNGNTAAGYNANNGAQGLLSSTGAYNTATGANAMGTNAVGYGGCPNSNTADGYQALDFDTTGNNNSADGYNALYNNNTGSGNVADGFEALSANNTPSNTAVGYQALLNLTISWGTNTAFGDNALYNTTTGSYNTAVGVNSGASNAEGSYGTLIGGWAGTEADLSNPTAIGAFAAAGQSNSVVLGSISGVNGCASPCATASVGIATTTPSHIFTIGQGYGEAYADGWATWSSRRWKTNIRPLVDALGKVERLRGVSYDLKATGQHQIGVIAEEVGEVVPEVVSYEKNGKDASGVDYSRLTALLIEAVKQQQALMHRQQAEMQQDQAQINSQKTENSLQQAEIAQLVSRVKTMRASLNTGRPDGSDIGILKAEAPIVHP